MNTRKEASGIPHLDPEQLQAVVAAPGPVCIIAGAGTGKTTALVARISHLIATDQWSAAHVLALTHSTKAAGEMRDRLGRSEDSRLRAVSMRTYHAAARALVQEWWTLTGRHGGLVLNTNPYPMIRTALRRAQRLKLDDGVVEDVVSAIMWAKASCITPSTYTRAAGKALREVEGLERSAVAKIFAAYEQALLEAQQIDFTDLLLIATELIETEPTVAEEVRNRYRHILVDEFQDTDPAQDRFLRAILGDRDDVTVVGDARQAIYSFKGADVSILHDFTKRFPNSTLVRLVRDYRSGATIVAAANKLQPGPDGEALVACGPSSEELHLEVATTEGSEATLVARKIRELIGTGTKPSEIAILYRFKAQSAAFEQALATAGIPYSVLGNDRFFDRKEITEVLGAAWSAMLRREPAPATSSAHSATSNSAPESGLPTTGQPQSPGKSGHGLLLEVLTEHGFDREKPPSTLGAVRDRWEARNALLEMVESFGGIDNMSARDLLEELALRRREDHSVTTESVSLATLHKAKGLEWDVVVLPRMVHGSLPSSFAKTTAAIEEERRLAYVGVTRARKILLLTYSEMRAYGTKTYPSKRSGFLDELGLFTTAKPSSTLSRTTPRRSTTLRNTSNPPPRPTRALSAEDRALYAALMTWRSDLATRESKPLFTILDDQALLTIATQRPKTKNELRTIQGVGAKCNSYGDELLQLVARHS